MVFYMTTLINSGATVQRYEGNTIPPGHDIRCGVCLDYLLNTDGSQTKQLASITDCCKSKFIEMRLYHRNCLGNWFLRRTSCPRCSRTIDSQNINLYTPEELEQRDKDNKMIKFFNLIPELQEMLQSDEIRNESDIIVKGEKIRDWMGSAEGKVVLSSITSLDLSKRKNYDIIDEIEKFTELKELNVGTK